jgi:hypothetical protein
VHTTGDVGRVSAHEPSLNGSGQVTIGAGGVDAAIRIVRHGDQVPFHRPGSSWTAARTTYWVLFVKAVAGVHDAVAPDAVQPVVHDDNTVVDDVEAIT